MSDISTKKPAVAVSSTDNTLLHGVTEKTATSSWFSERFKNTLGNFFSFTLGTGTGDEVDTQEEEEEDKEEIEDFESQGSLNSLNHGNEAYTNMENGHSEKFGSIRTIKKAIDGTKQSR